MRNTIGIERQIVRERRVQKPPMGALYALAFLLLFFPAGALAAGSYLERNAEQFIDQTVENYGEMVNIAALLHDYDPNMILAVIVVESEGKEKAVSHKGAEGLMQLMPQTAKSMGANNPKEPFQNILAGTKYLKQLEEQYGFPSSQAALVAYNMGPSRAKRWLSQYTPEEFLYVEKVMYVYGVLKGKEAERRRIASTVETKLAEAELPPVFALPFLTKPRSLSLAAFPMTLPSPRRNEVGILE